MACGDLPTPKAVDEGRGLWYCGSSNTDKSRKAAEENPKAFRKAQNRWFDGYNGERTIIMDDCDKRGIFLGQHLTSWTDTNPCTGKTKRGTIQLQHDKFIVTSNYSIDDLWGHDPEMCASIKVNFKIVHFEEPQTKRQKVRDNKDGGSPRSHDTGKE